MAKISGTWSAGNTPLSEVIARLFSLSYFLSFFLIYPHPLPPRFCINDMGLRGVPSEDDRSLLKPPSGSSSSFLWTVVTRESPRMISSSIASILRCQLFAFVSRFRACALACALQDLCSFDFWHQYAVSTAHKEIINNYFSCDCSMLCGREKYKFLELFTNFLFLTHGLMAYKRQKGK